MERRPPPPRFVDSKMRGIITVDYLKPIFRWAPPSREIMLLPVGLFIIFRVVPRMISNSRLQKVV